MKPPQEVRVRPLRLDDLAAISRWVEDPVYLSGFGEQKLDAPQTAGLKKRLRSFVESGDGWVAIVDNIRISALLRTNTRNSAGESHQYFLIPRISVDWSQLEIATLNSYGAFIGESKLTIPEVIVRKRHAPAPSSVAKQMLGHLHPPTGRRALLLGPLERNKNSIAVLRQFGFTVTQSMATEQSLSHSDFDLIVSSGYDRRLSESFVLAHSDHILNIHTARLPWGRGIGTTLFSQLLDYPLGVSIHLIDSGLDTGNLISESDVKELEHDTLRTIYASLLREADLLFSRTIETYLAGQAQQWSQERINPKSFARSRADFEDVLKATTLG